MGSFVGRTLTRQSNGGLAQSSYNLGVCQSDDGGERMTKEEALAAIGARMRATGFLRIAGCVLVYFWARGWVNYGVQGFGPEGAERIDLGFDTMPLILLPTVVAFWSDGIGMTILFLFGASVVSFFSPFAVALPLFLQ